MLTARLWLGVLLVVASVMAGRKYGRRRADAQAGQGGPDRHRRQYAGRADAAVRQSRDVAVQPLSRTRPGGSRSGLVGRRADGAAALAGLQGSRPQSDRPQADRALACFGFNESFGGTAGLAKFEQDLEKFIQETTTTKYDGVAPPRLVLVSPIAHENLAPPRTAGRHARTTTTSSCTPTRWPRLASKHNVLSSTCSRRRSS